MLDYLKSQEIILLKCLENKLEEIKNLKSVNQAVKLSKNQNKFLKGLIECLTNAIDSEEFNEGMLLEDYKLSISGDIFNGKYFD